MKLYASLAQVARLLILERDRCTPSVLIQAVLEAIGAERGFIVTHRGGSFELHFDSAPEAGGAEEAGEEPGFDRSLVERAMAQACLIEDPEIPGSCLDDHRSRLTSTREPPRRWSIVSPLEDRGNRYGVMYLLRDGGRLSPDARSFLSETGDLIAPFIREALEPYSSPPQASTRNQDLLARHDFGDIVTVHPMMMELLRTVVRVAPSRASVLIRGETGAGKELIARALHLNSERKAAPFVALHVSALQESVMEAELFGHVKGAFTGADRARLGRIVGAHGGTLFLDEVAEIPLRVQAKLLRFIQFGEVQPVGSDRVDKVDVRVIAATHQDLGAMMQRGHFREDLYYRLKVIELVIPPLRERASDVPLLIDAMLRRHWRRPGEGPPRLTRRAEVALRSYSYPGNVRELAHLIERACLLAAGPEIDLDVFPPEVQRVEDRPAGAERFVDYTAAELSRAREAARIEVERSFVEGLMKMYEENVSQAARRAGMHRSYLQRLLARRRP